MTSRAGRLLWLDLIRALAAQMIVLHHLAFYGPVAERLAEQQPALIGWFTDHARIAVQVFLVVSGFLVAQGALMRSPCSLASAGATLWRRYLRLFVPFMVAVVCTCLVSVVARHWVGPSDWATPWPDAAAILAHLTGTFDYLGIEALTVGAWYVSIDFQLQLVLVSILWLSQQITRSSQQASRLTWWAVFVLAVLSMGGFNRDPRWDVTPFYFFGAFALGLASGRLARAALAPSTGAVRAATVEDWLAVAVIAVAAIGVVLAPAIRPVVALLTALALLALARGLGDRVDRRMLDRTGDEGPFARFVGLCGRSAYSLFLFHFPLAVFANAIYARFFEGDLALAVAAALVAWLGALPLSWLMYWLVEARGFVRGRGRR